MEQDSELKRLESFVENLLTRFTELRAEKAVLLQEIRERDEVIDGLRENVSSKDTERSEISLRVGKIVEQIEEWEQSLDDSEFEEDSLPEGSSEEGSSAEETSSEDDAEAGMEDGKGQQNLFSMETS
ncbi:MAG: hypothetical protein KAI39_05080 [Desulfobulbaceae bacterium]|nr:hypothetical protein [Desulfobulbaceae bacterium]